MRATSLIFIVAAFGSAFAHSEEVICPNLKASSNRAAFFGESPTRNPRSFRNIDVPVLPDGSFVVGLGRNAPNEMDLTVGEDVVCSLNIATREYRISRVGGAAAHGDTPGRAARAHST